MELKETIDLMVSEKYYERFEAEYYQLKIRYQKLKNMLEKEAKNELNFTPTCDIGLLKLQLDCMLMYLIILEKRASLEEVILQEV